MNSFGDTSQSRSVIHVTDKSRDENVSRIPAVWFHARHDSELYVSIMCNGYNYMATFEPGWDPASGTTHNLRIEVRQNSSNRDVMKIFLDNSIVTSFTEFGGITESNGELTIGTTCWAGAGSTGKVYAGDPWYPEADINISNVKYEALA